MQKCGSHCKPHQLPLLLPQPAKLLSPPVVVPADKEVRGNGERHGKRLHHGDGQAVDHGRDLGADRLKILRKVAEAEEQNKKREEAKGLEGN